MTRSTFGLLILACGLVAASLRDCPVGVAGGLFNNRAVGGVAVDANGVLEAPTVQDDRELAQLRAEIKLQVPAGLQEYTDLRAVSLKQLEATLKECHDQMKPTPDEVKYLAGLQRVQYVFVYPDRNDIVIAGPAEGWQFDALGNVVGVTTNRPVILLDDLMVALRSGSTSRTEPITCSIDPTEEGLARLQAAVSRMRTMGDSEQTLNRIEEALGPQTISVTGVADTSHFARTMVAADFRMKRIAMDFEESPVKGMPSFLSMVSGGGKGMNNMLPRWWLAPDYKPLARTSDGLGWELRGQGVKCMSNEDYVDSTGERTVGVSKNPVAEKWAATMTEKYSELAEKDSSFGELRNIMDLAVIGALVEKEHLLNTAGLQLPRLMGEQSLERYPAPKHTASKASAIKKRGNWVISASGGVEMLPWHIASETETVETVGDVRNDLSADVKEFWWE